MRPCGFYYLLLIFQLHIFYVGHKHVPRRMGDAELRLGVHHKMCIRDSVNAAGCIKLNVEGYGGMIMSTWLDRPLSAAGRVLVRDEAAGTLESRLVDLDRDLLVIPSLAIHMDRTLNSGHAFNPQVDMQPLYGLEGSKPFPALLAEAAGVKEEDIVDFDLSLYTRQAPTRIGPDGELFMAPRIDDLECAATTLYGFLDAAPETDSACAPVWAMFDNEEVGSSTRQGADRCV